MANFISFPLQIVLTGDGVSLNATVALAVAPTSVSLVSAYGPTGADVSSNIASVNVVGSSIVFTFNAVFTGAIAVEVALASANYNSLPLQPVAQITSPWIVDGSAVTQPSNITKVAGIALSTPTAWGSVPSGTVIGGNVELFAGNTSLVADGSGKLYVNINGESVIVSGSVAVTNLPATQPVSAASLPLPTGAATASAQATEVASLATLVTNSPALASGRVPVDGSGVTQPISAAALPLPTSAATSALQTTGNTSVASIDTKTPALASGRVPVDGSGVTQPVSGAVSVSNFPATQPVSLAVAPTTPVTGTFYQATQPVSAAALPLPAGAATVAKQPALGTAGTPSADVISVQGASGMTAVKVDGSGVTQPVSGTVAVSNFPATQPVSLAVAPTTPVTGTFFQGTQPVSLATAPTTPVTGTFFQATQPVSAAALPLPTGAATSANQPVPVAKGTQGASATPTQDLKDSGRTSLTFYLDDLTGSSSEVLATMGITKGGAAQTAATSYTVTAGKILRLTSIAFTVRSSTNASEQSKIRVRTAASSIAVTSPIVINMLGTAPAAGTFAQNLTIPDGYEIAGGNQIAISHIEPISANSTQITVCLVGFEY